jgi:hypothetical protein
MTTMPSHLPTTARLHLAEAARARRALELLPDRHIHAFYRKIIRGMCRCRRSCWRLYRLVICYLVAPYPWMCLYIITGPNFVGTNTSDIEAIRTVSLHYITEKQDKDKWIKEWWYITSFMLFARFMFYDMIQHTWLAVYISLLTKLKPYKCEETGTYWRSITKAKPVANHRLWASEII